MIERSPVQISSKRTRWMSVFRTQYDKRLKRLMVRRKVTMPSLLEMRNKTKRYFHCKKVSFTKANIFSWYWRGHNLQTMPCCENTDNKHLEATGYNIYDSWLPCRSKCTYSYGLGTVIPQQPDVQLSRQIKWWITWTRRFDRRMHHYLKWIL